MSASIHKPGVDPNAAVVATLLGNSLDLEGFRLAGGTALAWHLGHRISEDLDFFSFTPGVLDTQRIEEITKTLRRLDPNAERQVSERTIHGSINGCRVSFFEVEGAWFDSPLRLQEGIDLATVPELAAMKLVAVMTRCAKKDFYDLTAIARSGLSLGQMVECGRRMYAGFDQALPHLRRALVYFEEAESDPDPVTIAGMTWPTVKREMQAMARDFGKI